MPAPDFESLRAERNAQFDAFLEKMRGEGWQVNKCWQNNKDACYCDCANGGPCEHDWNGEPYKSDDGLMWSATCARCGIAAISHSLHCGF